MTKELIKLPDKKKTLKGEYKESVWKHLAGTISELFGAGGYGQIAVKVINDQVNELLIVNSLDEAEKEK